nr:hypothetical protein [Rhodovulum steppense]
MAVSFRSTLFEGEEDHRPAGEGGGQRMLGLQGIGRRGQHLVPVAIQIGGTRLDQPCGFVMVGPVEKETQGQHPVGMGPGNRLRAVLGRDILEIRQRLEVAPQAVGIQGPAEILP